MSTQDKVKEKGYKMDDGQNNLNQGATPQPAPEPAPAVPQALVAPAETPAEPATSTEPAAPAEPASPKEPMNPKTKKTIILLCCIGGGVIILAILAIIFLPMLLKADYSESYKYAKQIDDKISRLAYSNNCDDVVYYYDSYFTSNKTFDGYIEECHAITDGLSSLVEKLGQTSGIKRNSDLQEGYNSFKDSFDKLAIDSESLSQKLNLYKAWHTFIVARDNLDELSNDSSYNAAASVLTESGSEVLKEYGTEWLKYALAYTKAYKDYFDSSNNENKGEKRQAYWDADDDLEEFVDEHKPDLETIAPINMENASAVAIRFDDLFKAIAETYSKNYNNGSGDCEELFGEVYCPY